MMDILLDSAFSFYYPKDYTIKDFSHYTNELILFLSGDGETTINTISYPYKRGDICFTKVGDLRDHLCMHKSDYICIRFLGDKSVSHLNSGLYKTKDNILFDLFKQVLDEYQHKNYKYLELCCHKLSEIILYLSRLSINHYKEQSIYQLIKDIDSTLLFNQSVQEMADSLCYSYDYFRHVFKDITGKSPMQYIISKRLENACLLLAQKKYSCTEISQLCGFSSSAQFSTLFKKYLGLSPNQYQALIDDVNAP